MDRIGLRISTKALLEGLHISILQRSLFSIWDNLECGINLNLNSNFFPVKGTLSKGHHSSAQSRSKEVNRGAQALGTASYNLQSKVFLRRNSDQNMPKIGVLKKAVKIVTALGLSLNPRWPPKAEGTAPRPQVLLPPNVRTFSPRNFSVVRTFSPRKKNKVNNCKCYTLLFPRFCAYFSLQTLQFWLVRRKNFFSPGLRIPVLHYRQCSSKDGKRG